ncbi:MAG TPA: alpha/beta fold hydrolase, partial [Polyangia bacterium]
MRSAVLGTIVLSLVGVPACAENATPPSDSATAIGAPTLVETVEAAAFTERLRTGKSECCGPGQLLLQLAGEPKCSVKVYRYGYRTIDARGKSAEAGGALMLPSGPVETCGGPRPVALYTHGTTFEREFDMTDGGKGADLNRWEWANTVAFYAARGYVVVAPNYVGYAGSSADHHPYLNGEQQGRDVVDAFKAARSHFSALGVKDAGKLFITGYSQGGYVAMATQRIIQRDFSGDVKVTAVAAGAGPYALSNQLDTIFMGAAIPYGSFFMPLLMNGWQAAYGDLYSSPADAFAAPFSDHAATALPSKLSIPDLVAMGHLPANALFEAGSEPGPMNLGSLDPGLGLVFQGGFAASGYLIKTPYRKKVVDDIKNQPCNDPVRGLDATCKPTSSLRQAALRNDLRNFVPNVPLT